MATKKLIMCQGLPGSGKSTWAKSQVNAIVVNKDSIRQSLEEMGWKWSQANEKDVIEIRDQRIKGALLLGTTCISDDTNFGFKHEPRLRQIAEECGAEFEIKSFTDVDVEECIKRDSRRTGKAMVGEKVIRGMAAANGLNNKTEVFIEDILNKETPIETYKPDPLKPSTIICDLDGTLALFQGLRGPFEHDKCALDKVNDPVKVMLEVYYRFMGWKIIYLSGREDKYRIQTNEFLRSNCCPPGDIMMRTTSDFRKDWLVKYEIFDRFIRKDYNVRFVLDDRNQVVQMWRKLGLTCLQVADGNF